MAFTYTFSEFVDDTIEDWASWGTAIAVDSYLETGHDILEDVIAEKEANTVYCFFKTTEESVTSLGPPIVYDKPSSCMMRAKWHWADSASSGRWSTPQEVYRLDPHYAPTATGAYDYGFEVVQTINQVRGKGRSLVLRFESSEEKDFHLLGWSIPYTVITGA